MRDIYTIIAYRPDGSDYCRGCLMGTSSSELETGIFNDLTKAGDFLFKILQRQESMKDEREYCSWEIIFLVNGDTFDYNVTCYDADFLDEEFESLAQKYADTRKKVFDHAEEKLRFYKEELIRKKEEDARLKAEKEKAAKLARERKKYEELKAKFEGE